ncbi:MAG: hypothetical protein IPO18_20520 [bacterium]|nr:hypothetical protein [bacterium]
MAVANGSGTAQGQGYAPGTQLISYEYYSFLVDLIGNVQASARRQLFGRSCAGSSTASGRCPTTN